MVELRAMASPLRLRILSLLTGAALTAAEVARELGLTHANATTYNNFSRWTRIEVAGEERIRGVRPPDGGVEQPGAARCASTGRGPGLEAGLAAPGPDWSAGGRGPGRVQ